LIGVSTNRVSEWQRIWYAARRYSHCARVYQCLSDKDVALSDLIDALREEGKDEEEQVVTGGTPWNWPDHLNQDQLQGVIMSSADCMEEPRVKKLHTGTTTPRMAPLSHTYTHTEEVLILDTNSSLSTRSDGPKAIDQETLFDLSQTFILPNPHDLSNPQGNVQFISYPFGTEGLLSAHLEYQQELNHLFLLSPTRESPSLSEDASIADSGKKLATKTIIESTAHLTNEQRNESPSTSESLATSSLMINGNINDLFLDDHSI
jgi:hypothetical protein